MKLRSPLSTRFKRAAAVSGVLLVASTVTLLAVRARAAGIPAANALTYTGYLETPDGTPMKDAVEVSVAVWDAQKDGARVCGAEAATVTPVAGRFQLALPDCQAAVGASPDLWLETTVAGTSLGRTKLGAVPYAVEANHALAADTAAEGSPLAAQLTDLQAGLDGLKARADGPLDVSLAASQGGSQVVLDKADWTWISGVAPTKLAAGRYWVSNTSRTWAVAAGCTSNCTYALVMAVACMRVGNKLTAGQGQVIAEALKADLSLPFATTEAFDIAKETADVELGLCAKRNTLGVTYDAKVADTYTTVLVQAK
jgi:hypothetical protein